ncbi:hypothetical protein H257_03430 [Aphanomyces astaci]|uniref:HAT C-terminal dimerisation domain-containing protein n=1 Tax=Aphanomyces astaci TaxID=112090 RepID=W4GWN7_APHAT|nr:hypothetical protein H257_03430 [Aphanomyces astaci]ETV84120.1 hypothetical protein H257_03430 [Aphanomyces astaci]|eukprot:XP_009825812.1 hypothetical protein H257_03430 [Aphanomyces astaci]
MSSAPSNALRGKALAELYFTRMSPDSRIWECHYGVHRTQNASGYTNLCSHINTDHPEHATLASTPGANPSHHFESMVPSTVHNVFGWLAWITMSLLPFAFCENVYAKRYTTLGSMTTNTLWKYIHLVCQVVEAKLRRTLSSKFAHVFDGWTSGSTHYVAVFATFPSDNVICYQRVLLSFAQMNDEESLSADAHLNYIQFVLDYYGNSMDNVVTFVGDNCSTNVALLIGLDAHCTHDKRNSLKFRLYMVQRYVGIRTFIALIDDDVDLDELRLSTREDREVDMLLAQLENFDTVTLALQRDTMSLSDVRILFDTVMEDYPQVVHYLSPSATIVQQPNFENGCLRVAPLEAVVAEKHETYAERALKRQRRVPSEDKFLDCRFIIPTSNICERFFSATKRAIGDHRCGSLPKNFESQSFLYANVDMWSMDEVQKIMQANEK